MSCMAALRAIVVSSMFSCYSLDGNGITDKGFGMLAKALKLNKSLESLRSVTALHSVCAIVVISMFSIVAVLMVIA